MSKNTSGSIWQYLVQHDASGLTTFSGTDQKMNLLTIRNNKLLSRLTKDQNTS